MNPNTRHHCIEMLVNDSELSGLNTVCQALGVAKSVFLRGLLNAQVRSHGKAPEAPKESRVCRGAGRPASRASVDMRRQV